MSDYLLESYQYEDLPQPPPGTFRIVELLPGKSGDIVSCLLHVADWTNPPDYEALSYAWGDPNAKATILCHGKKIAVTQVSMEDLLISDIKIRQDFCLQMLSGE